MQAAASQLIEGSVVSFDLGGDAKPLRCRVVAFGGDEVVLAATAAPDADQQAALSLQGEAFLLLDEGQSLRALRCRVCRHKEDGEVVAQIVDGFRLGQRRMFSRAALVLPATVTPLAGDGQPAGEAWRTFTRDVSAGGARLARQSGYATAGRHALVLDVPFGDRPVEAVIEVRRESPDDLGVCFVQISPADRQRIEGAALSWQLARLRGGAAGSA